MLVGSTFIVSSWLTRYSIDGGRKIPDYLRRFTIESASFPSRMKGLIELLYNYNTPEGMVDIYKQFVPINGGSKDLSGYILVSRVNTNGMNSVLLVRLRDGFQKVLIEMSKSEKEAEISDQLDGSKNFRHIPLLSRHRIWNPCLSNEGMMYYCEPWGDLISFNLKNRTEQWRIRGAFHHSIEMDHEGNLWVCGAATPDFSIKDRKNISQSNPIFEDQVIVKISNRGKILDTISVSKLLLENGLEHLLYGGSNPNLVFDPIHLNQITPVTDEANILKKGQIVVSLRNLSTVLLVDPPNRRVIWSKTGPWMNQHSVKVVGNDTLMLLDNHSFASSATGDYWLNPKWQTRLIRINLQKNNFDYILPVTNGIVEWRIPTEGVVFKCSNDSIGVEDSKYGTVLIFNNSNLVGKWSNKYPNGNVGITSWCRYVPEELIKNLDWIEIN